MASAGLALKYGLDVRDVNSQLDQYRRFMCPGEPPMSMNCDINATAGNASNGRPASKSALSDG